MGLTKGILLGTGAALVSVAAAQAADLPSRKAAPVEYVRVCDAYGAGFFFIPGTQTCLRIGGRVRADYAFVPAKNIYQHALTPTAAAATTGPTVSRENAQHTVGWEARARITFDARTQTAWGTVQASAALRMARTKGVLQSNDGAQPNGHNTGSTLESAFIRFAGFTFGASRDNFASMPSLTYGAGHWASFANGAKQLAYTHVFGGGFSGTIALQDWQDTTVGAQTSPAVHLTAGAGGNPYFVHNSIPQINGRLDWQQGWGEINLVGAWARINASNIGSATVPANNFDADTNVWAIGGTVKINLPMLASGSALWLHAAYADGMTEYTTNWTSVKTTAYNRDVGGYTMNHPSFVYERVGGVDRIDTVKSWNIAALLQHFWTPQYRSVVWGSYGSLNAPLLAETRAWNGLNSFGDAKAWNIGTNFAWLPTRDFEIGVEVIYARVSQNINAAAAAAPAFPALTGKASDSNVTGRLRVERNF